MKWNLLLLWASCICILYQVVEVDSVKCEIWDHNHQNETKECIGGCMAVWYNISGEVDVKHKNCWEQNDANKNPKEKCEGRTRILRNKPDFVICHCFKDLCTAKLTWVGYEDNTKSNNTTSRPQHVRNNDHILYVVMAIVGTTLVLLVLFIVYMIKRRDLKAEPESVSKGSEVETLLPSEELPPIDLQDILSQGQFCIVRKGRMGYKNVAVKIFPITQCSKPTPSALTETDMYMVCKLSHENILKFIGKHVQEEGNQQQLWLVTEYIEQGSLSDFLKRNTINWENLFHMAQGMAQGMAYLHAEIPRVKPSIAHRDMKSKNILVKNNLTCCISDFGLSLKFDNKEGPGDTHGQVGTRRYMAPEVLEGAINFSREAFLRIDMYAFALCLWELLTRCTAVQEEPLGDYKLPFEEEVGVHPSLEELQDFVVNKKLRPSFPAEWRDKDQAIDGVIDTIEECWDHDADARLTADCVAERVKQFRAAGKRPTNPPLSISYKSLEQENALLA